MSGADLADILNATLTVRPYLGVNNASVPVFGDEVDVPGWLTRKQQFVRDVNGDQITSQATFSADPSFVDTLAPKSQVTIAGEQPTTVISRAVSVGGQFIDGLDRVKVWLQ